MGLYGSALTTNFLSLVSEFAAEDIEGLLRNKVVAPRFQGLLTLSGDVLYGIQTIVKPKFAPIEVKADTTLDFSSFSLAGKVHDIKLTPNLSISPFVSISTRKGFLNFGDWGGSIGSDISYKLNSRLGVQGTFGYRGSSSPLNEIEGKESGVSGSVKVQVTLP